MKSDEKKHTKKPNNNFLRNFALILGLIAAAIVVLIKYNPHLFDSLFKEKSSTAKQILTQDNKADKTPVGESYSVGPDPSLPSFSPDDSELDEEEEGTLGVAEDIEPQPQHPYEIEVENDERAEQSIEFSEKQMRLIKEVNDYRLFLANAERLITKFRQDQVFYNELKFFNSITHPNMIKNTLFLLKEYDEMLSNPECVATDKFVEIFSMKPWNKFIKVTKTSKASQAHKQLKDGISESLPILVNYIYSPELQWSFIK